MSRSGGISTRVTSRRSCRISAGVKRARGGGASPRRRAPPPPQAPGRSAPPPEWCSPSFLAVGSGFFAAGLGGLFGGSRRMSQRNDVGARQRAAQPNWFDYFMLGAASLALLVAFIVFASAYWRHEIDRLAAFLGLFSTYSG